MKAIKSHGYSLGVSPGTLAPEEIPALLGKANPTIIEVGANCGQTTQEMLRVMPGATIYAFEPDPRAIAKFHRTLTHQNVHLFECAVGSLNGSTTFYQSSGGEDLAGCEEGWDLSGSIRKPCTHLRVWPWVKFEKQIEVPVTTLDTWANRYGIHGADFLWADVQGAEGDLINGARSLLGSTAYFYTEYSNDEWYEGQISLAELIQQLPGFELIRRYPMDALFRNKGV